MKYSQFITSAAVVAMANAHATIMHAWINDVDQGLGNTAAGYIRSPPNNNPIKDITSSDLTCNVNNVATAKTLDVAPGDKVFRTISCNEEAINMRIRSLWSGTTTPTRLRTISSLLLTLDH